ncbi:MAG: response regulator [Saprospiraceae bacterium]|nr:response regulator [Saprospiraceae bacterium]
MQLLAACWIYFFPAQVVITPPQEQDFVVSHEIVEAFEDSTDNTEVLLVSGKMAHDQARYDDALHLFFQALDQYEINRDTTAIASTLTQIGQSYLRLRKNQEAGEVFHRALQLHQMTNNLEGIQVSTADVGVALQRLGQIEPALLRYKQSLVMARRLANISEEAILLGNIGSSYRALANYDSSIHFLKEALQLKMKTGTGSTVAHTLNDLAETFFEYGDYDQALEYAHLALDTSIVSNAVSQHSYARLTLSRIYEKIGNYQSAFDFLASHKIMYDSINSVQKDQVISDLKIKYETSRKEQVITQLESDYLQLTQHRRLWATISLAIILTVSMFCYVLWNKRQNDRILLAKTKSMEDARSRFFANISHDFRTPLSLIIGPLNLLRSQFKGTDAERKLNTIQQNAFRLIKYIEQIMDLSNIDQNQLILKVAQVNVVNHLKSVLGSFQLAAEGADIHLTFEGPEDVIYLYLDPHHLESIMANLISNALKYSISGDTICVLVNQTTSGQVEIFIRDTGSGIAADDLPHIFERYFHRDRQGADAPGLGIGLALCKSLVELHGGTIEARSEAGAGAEFKLTFIAGTKHLEGRPDVIFSYADYDDFSVKETFPMPVEREVTPLVPGDGPFRILIIEDSDEMCAFIKEVLESRYKIVVAANGLNGLKIAQETIPDLIVSDIMMPGLDGLTLCAKLKNDVRTSHIPIILLTAKNADQDRLSGLEAKADAYLVKPFIPQELLLRIHNQIELRQKLHRHYQHESSASFNEVMTTSTDQKFLIQMETILERQLSDSNFGVVQLAQKLHLSRSQLHRKLKALTGQTPILIIRTFRLRRAYDFLTANSGSVAEVGYDVGFSSPSYFIKCFHQQFGITPGEVSGKI